MRDNHGMGLAAVPRGRGVGRPRVYLHVGEPKTGTTFLQDVLWANRAVLAGRGIVLPGYHRRDHSRASRDLRETPREASDVADPWLGEWDVLAGQALRAPRAAVISDEILAACTPAQADRAIRSLSRAEVHVILTVRDLSVVLPAEWQEAVKCRGTIGWEPWLRAVAQAGLAGDRRARSWFWSVHDTPACLAMWCRSVPADRVHVITTPRHGPADLLWTRFAAVLGIDPAGVDISQARRNSSLSYAQTEFLRRINEALPADLPYWFYTRHIKQILAHGVLREYGDGGRLFLPPEFRAWARRQAELICAGVRSSGCRIVGDPNDLLPSGAGSAGAAPARQPSGLRDVAVQSVVALACELYGQSHADRGQREPFGGPRQALSRLEWTVLHGRWVQRTLRRTSQLRAVRRLRVAIWCVLMHPARPRTPVASRTGGQLTAADAAVGVGTTEPLRVNGNAVSELHRTA